MINEVILVGRIVELPPLTCNSNELYCQMKIAVRKSAMEPDREIILPISIWKGLATIANEKYQLGTTVGIRGRLDVVDDFVEIIAERVSFISAEEH